VISLHSRFVNLQSLKRCRLVSTCNLQSIECAGSLVQPPLSFLSVGGLNSVLNGEPAEKFTFRHSPRFPDECFKVVVGCAYKLGVVSRL
jgi:hypothetical protein